MKARDKRFTKAAFGRWLAKQPSCRQFNNGFGNQCMGHYFCIETGISNEDYHYVEDMNILSGGWFKKWFLYSRFNNKDTAGEFLKYFQKFTKKTFKK